MGSPLQFGHRRLQQRPHHQRHAGRCLELFVHRQRRFRSSPRKKQGPEKSRFRLTAKPVRRRICPRLDARQAQQTVCEVTGLTSGKHRLALSIAAPDRWPWMPWLFDRPTDFSGQTSFRSKLHAAACGFTQLPIPVYHSRLPNCKSIEFPRQIIPIWD